MSIPPLAGALWETMVFTEFRRLLDADPASWQLSFWRDRTREADFLLHRAGRIKLADAKWSELPQDSGRLERVRAQFASPPVSAIVCRAPNPYPLGQDVFAYPLGDLRQFLDR